MLLQSCAACQSILAGLPLARQLRNSIVTVANYTGVSLCQLAMPSRLEHICYAKNLCWAVLVDHQQHSSIYLSSFFNLNSSSIRHALGKFRTLQRLYPNIQTDISNILKNLHDETSNQYLVTCCPA